MTNSSGGGRHRNTDDEPTERFPALRDALNAAIEDTAPLWPATDPDEQ